MSDNKGKRVLFSMDRYDLSKQENTPPESPSSQETAAVNSAPAEPIVSPSVSPIASAMAEAANVTPPSEINPDGTYVRIAFFGSKRLRLRRKMNSCPPENTCHKARIFAFFLTR